MSTQSNRRRRFAALQPGRAQFLLALLIVGYMLVFSGLTHMITVGRESLSVMAQPGGATPQDFARLLRLSQPPWFAIGIMTLAAALHWIFIAHRVFGPMNNVLAVSRRVTAGDLTQRLHFRQHDEMLEIRDSLNEMIKSFDSRTGASQKGLLECQAALQTFEQAQGDQQRAEATWRLRAALDGLGEQLLTVKASEGARADQLLIAPVDSVDEDAASPVGIASGEGKLQATEPTDSEEDSYMDRAA